MNTKEIADELIKMCRDGKVEEVKEKFFTEETVSLEPREGILPKETKGLMAIQKKAELFISMVDDFYGSKISEPMIAGDYFSVLLETDIKMKGEARKTDKEICVYKTQNGKIISEQFFY